MVIRVRLNHCKVTSKLIKSIKQIKLKSGEISNDIDEIL